METLSLWSLVIDGGYIMIPIALMLVVSIYIFVERCIAISRASKDDNTFMQKIRDYVHEGDLGSAKNLCKRPTPHIRV